MVFALGVSSMQGIIASSVDQIQQIKDISVVAQDILLFSTSVIFPPVHSNVNLGLIQKKPLFFTFLHSEHAIVN